MPNWRLVLQQKRLILAEVADYTAFHSQFNCLLLIIETIFSTAIISQECKTLFKCKIFYVWYTNV